MAPTTQKALVIPAEKEPFKLVTDWPVPQPGPTDVLVKVVSAAINPVDAYVQAQGIPGLVPGYPTIPGFDGAGVVEEVGAEVTNVAKGDKVIVQGTFKLDNRNTTFQEYTVQPAKFVAKIPDNITFDQAATISLCLATVVNGIWGHEEDSTSARFTPPWEEGGTTKYAGQAALILGGGTNVGQFAIQCARMQGFYPIISTASPQNSALLLSLGATHVLDRTLAPDALRAALASIVPATAANPGPITYVYDAFGRGRDAQRLGYSVLAPGGAFVTVIPFDDSSLTDLVEESARKGEGKRVARARAGYTVSGNGALGVEIFKRLTGWLESGAIVPSRLEVVPGGLSGVAEGCKRMLTWDVGAKLVVRIDETP
ncbi:hypothetical protein GSI_12362 [Ganoderma sinense ZZ0214-1]|uniref:Enoyl reductase (ER) domain-containing protein n=1 Tax=Ganoderma sinense ZZ0214-1 TaxID=1077348 RepID=A0A2G8RYP4_9APHY|nr:hypothetical protein GSI_12362 [Ganoderma sinense ZZ0214-1]